MITFEFDSANNQTKRFGFTLCARRDVTPGCQDPYEVKRCSGLFSGACKTNTTAFNDAQPRHRAVCVIYGGRFTSATSRAPKNTDENEPSSVLTH